MVQNISREIKGFRCKTKEYDDDHINKYDTIKQRNDILLDLFIDGGFRFIGIFLSGKRILRNRGNEHQLLLHLFKGLEQNTRKRPIVRLLCRTNRKRKTISIFHRRVPQNRGRRKGPIIQRMVPMIIEQR